MASAENRVVVTKNKTRIINISKIGPQGLKGDKGDTGIASLGEVPDVTLESLNNNDVLQYESSTQLWKNVPQEDIVDGGNF